MRSKRTVWTATVALAVVVGTGWMAWAQAGQNRRGFNADRAVGRLAQQMNLTAEQKTTVKGFLEDAAAQLRALRDNTSLSREQRMQQMQNIRQQTRDKIRSILTVEQQLKVEELQKQARERMAAQQQQMADGATNQLVKRLDLTEAQRTTIRSYFDEQATELRALRENTSLTPEQKREQMRTLRQQTQQKIRTALTADQQQRLEELRNQARERFRGRMGRMMMRRGGRMRGQ